MNKKFLSAILFGAMLATSAGTFVSCKDYDDDIKNLQTQIDTNKTAIAELQKLVGAGNWVTNVAASGENLVVTMSNGTTATIAGIKGADGVDGKDAAEWTISEDGFWCKDGEKTTNVAVAQNGKDGKDGVSAPSPTISDNGMWVVYSWDAAKGEFVAEETEIPAAGTSAYAVKANGVYTLYIADENGEMQEITLPATCDSFVASIPAHAVYVNVQKAKWNTKSSAHNKKVFAVLTEEFPALADLKDGDNLTQGGELPLLINPSNVELNDEYSFALVDVKGKTADIELSNPQKGISDAWDINIYGEMSRSAKDDNCLWTLDVTPAYNEKSKSYASASQASLVVTNAKGVTAKTAFGYVVETTDAANVSVTGNDGLTAANVPYAETIDLFANFTYGNNAFNAPIQLNNEYEGYYLISLTNDYQVEKYGLSIEGSVLKIEKMPADVTTLHISINVKAVGLNASTVNKDITLSVGQVVAADKELDAKSIEFNGKDQYIKWDIEALGLNLVELDEVLSAKPSVEVICFWTDEKTEKNYTLRPTVALTFYNKKGGVTKYEEDGVWSNGEATQFGFKLNAKNDANWIAPMEYDVILKATKDNTVIYKAETTLTTSLPEITDSYIKLASAYVEEGVLQITGEVKGGKVTYNLNDAFVYDSKIVTIDTIEDTEWDEDETDNSVSSRWNWVENSPILSVNTWTYEPENGASWWSVAEHNQLYTQRHMKANIYFFGNKNNKAVYEFDLQVLSTIYDEDPTSVITLDATKLNTYFGATGKKVATVDVKKAVYAAGPNRGTAYEIYRTVETGNMLNKVMEYSNYQAPVTNGNFLTTATGQLIEIEREDWLAMGVTPEDFTSEALKDTKLYLVMKDREIGSSNVLGWETIARRMAEYYEWAYTDDDKKAATWQYQEWVEDLMELTEDELSEEDKIMKERIAVVESLFNKYVSNIAFEQLKDKYQAKETATAYHKDIKSINVAPVDALEAAKYCTWDGMTIKPVSKPVDVKDVKVPFVLTVTDVYGMIMELPFEVSIVTTAPAN